MAKTMNNKENYNVSKYFDIQNCYKEDYFSNLLENKKETSKTHSKSGSINLSNSNTPLINKGMALNIQEKSKNFIPFDKNFKICLKIDKNQFTKKDIIYYKNKEIKMTNSVVFYLNYFYKKVHYIRFNTKISDMKPKTVNIIINLDFNSVTIFSLACRTTSANFVEKFFLRFYTFPHKKFFGAVITCVTSVKIAYLMSIRSSLHLF
jgi:hypothetical protein